MTKCDFCTYSDSNGKCFWSLQAVRAGYCEEAIRLMIEALKNINNKK